MPATLKSNGSTGLRPEEGRADRGKGAPGDFKPEYRKEGGFGRGRDEYRRKQEA